MPIYPYDERFLNRLLAHFIRQPEQFHAMNEPVYIHPGYFVHTTIAQTAKKLYDRYGVKSPVPRDMFREFLREHVGSRNWEKYERLYRKTLRELYEFDLSLDELPHDLVMEFNQDAAIRKFHEENEKELNRGGPTRALEHLKRFEADFTASEAATLELPAYKDIPYIGDAPVQDAKPLVQGLIPKFCVTMLVAPSDTYKSYLMLELGNALFRSGLFLGHRAAMSRAVYFDLDNPLNLLPRRWAEQGWYPRGIKYVRPPVLIGHPWYRQIAQALKGAMFFDSHIRLQDAEENSATEVARVMREYRFMGDAGSTPIILHHTPQSEIRPRGSTDFKAAVDVLISIRRDDKDESLLWMECIRDKVAGGFKPICFRPRISEGFRRMFEVVDWAGEKNEEAKERLWELIDNNRGASTHEVEKLRGGNKKQTAQLLNQLLQEGKLKKLERPGRGGGYAWQAVGKRG